MLKRIVLCHAIVTLVVLHLTPGLSHSRSVDANTSIPKGKCTKYLGASGSYRNTTNLAANEEIVLGKSSRGRAIVAEHWGSKTGPQLLVIGQVHGNECSPAYLVRELRRNPSKDVGIWLIPTLNPDGLAQHSRRNGTGVDLNRDGFRRQARETRILIDFVKEYKPTFTVHVHSPSGWVGHFNGDLAKAVCRDIARRSGLSCRGAGRAKEPGAAFLWEGLAKHVPGHQSLVVELPRISPREAASAPRHWVVQATRQEVKRYAETIRRVLTQPVRN